MQIDDAYFEMLVNRPAARRDDRLARLETLVGVATRVRPPIDAASQSWVPPWSTIDSIAGHFDDGAHRRATIGYSSEGDGLHSSHDRSGMLSVLIDRQTGKPGQSGTLPSEEESNDSHERFVERYEKYVASMNGESKKLTRLNESIRAIAFPGEWKAAGLGMDRRMTGPIAPSHGDSDPSQGANSFSRNASHEAVAFHAPEVMSERRFFFNSSDLAPGNQEAFIQDHEIVRQRNWIDSRGAPRHDRTPPGPSLDRMLDERVRGNPREERIADPIAGLGAAVRQKIEAAVSRLAGPERPTALVDAMVRAGLMQKRGQEDAAMQPPEHRQPLQPRENEFYGERFPIEALADRVQQQIFTGAAEENRFKSEQARFQTESEARLTVIEEATKAAAEILKTMVSEERETYSTFAPGG